VAASAYDWRRRTIPCSKLGSGDLERRIDPLISGLLRRPELSSPNELPLPLEDGQLQAAGFLGGLHDSGTEA
jgi:hypothetical protein